MRVLKFCPRHRHVSIPAMVNQMNWLATTVATCDSLTKRYHVSILCVDNNVDTKIDIFLCKVFLFFDF